MQEIDNVEKKKQNHEENYCATFMHLCVRNYGEKIEWISAIEIIMTEKGMLDKLENCHKECREDKMRNSVAITSISNNGSEGSKPQ